MAESACLRLLLAGLLVVSGPALAASEEAGVAAAVNPEARGTPPAGATRFLEVGTNIVVNEKVQTSANGQTQLLFRDGSTVTVGPNAQLTIDSFVYDPARRTATLAMTNAGGLMRFVGGRASKEGEGVTIKTPTATIGIRGGIGETNVIPQTGETFARFLFGDRMSVTSSGGSQSLTTANFEIGIKPDGSQSLPRFVTPQDIAATQGQLEGKSGKQGGGGSQTDDSGGKLSSVNSGSSSTQNGKVGDVVLDNGPPEMMKKVTEQASIFTSNSIGPTINISLFGPICLPTCTLKAAGSTTFPSYTYGSTTESGSVTVEADASLNIVKYKATSTSSSTGTRVATYTFVDTSVLDIQSFKDLRIGGITGGHIDIEDSYSGPASIAPASTYILPFALGNPVVPSLMPVSADYTYSLLGATPVYDLNGGTNGTFSGSIAVHFGSATPDSSGYNLTAKFNSGSQLDMTAAGHGVLSFDTSTAMNGSTYRGNFSTSAIALTGGICSSCSAGVHGVFAGSTGDKIGLVYKVTGDDVNLSGAAALGR